MFKPPTVTAQTVHAWSQALRFVPTPQGDIALMDKGEGRVVLLIHGFPLNSFQWRDVISILAREARCLAPDLLAFGQTRTAEGQRVSFADQVQMIIALLDQLQVGAVDVVASDSGSGIAQMLAVGHSARVRSLLLTNGDVEPDSPPPALLPIIDLAVTGQLAAGFLTMNYNDKAFARSVQGIIGLSYSDPDKVTDATIEGYLGPLVGTSARRLLVDAYTAAMAPNPLEGLEAGIRALDCPMRVVWGMADGLFAAGDADYLDGIFKQSRGVRRLTDAKLFFPEEQPEVIAEEVRYLWGSANYCPQ